MDKMTNITKSDLALIGVRLLAIYVALQAISSIPTWIWTLSRIFGQSPPSDISDPFILKLLTICLLLLTLLIPIIIWVFSANIANFITKTPHLISNKDIADINIKDLQTMIFCAVGLFVFLTTAPTFIALLYDFIRVYMKSLSFESKWGSQSLVIILSLKMILSLFLIFSAQGLSNIIYKIRYAGRRF
jgi:hypothetical protein